MFVIGCIIGGAVLIAAFAAYGLPYPLLPARIFKNTPYLMVVFSGLFITVSFYLNSFPWPIAAAVLYPGSLLSVGWITTCVGAGILLGGILAGCFVKILGHHKWQMIIYNCIGASFWATMAAANPGNKSTSIAVVVLAHTGVGAVECIIYTLAMLLCDPEDLSLSFGVMASFRTLLAPVATAIYGSVLTYKLTINIPKYVIPVAIEQGLPASEIPPLIQGLSTGNPSVLKGIAPNIIAASFTAFQHAYTVTFRLIYLSCLSWGLLAIVFACFVPNMKNYFTDFVGKKLQGREIEALMEKQSNFSHLEGRSQQVEERVEDA
ncbi:hypothetical protein H2204_002226 [Knufia peltigerae]|uniref:Uncharacterized protein n=1 Tax=Knufia peltigerae TaxID=1002370 RepID=A0AA39D202_9EURO|nr:hypothetical protein H2204_002226 [Knufia peltigerae]